MNDFRMLFFLTVAKYLNFTKASNELHISQPAVSQHIHELENMYGMPLFERTKNSIVLTPQGELFLQYATDIHRLYRTLDFEMSLFSQQQKGHLQIGASTTIAQYILPGIMAKFMARFPEVKLSLMAGNTEQIEQAVAGHKVDLGIIEGFGHKKEFHYSLLAKDELVLVTSVKNKSKEEITRAELLQLPLVLRENGSGTLAVIQNALKEHNIKLSDLNIILQLGSTESIKRFLNDSRSYAILSIAAILDELAGNQFKVVEIEGLTFMRDFSFIQLSGSQNRLAEKFSDFAGLTMHK